MPCVDHINQLCNTCVVTKLKHRLFPRQASYCAIEQIELVHGNLGATSYCSSTTPPAICGPCCSIPRWQLRTPASATRQPQRRSVAASSRCSTWTMAVNSSNARR